MSNQEEYIILASNVKTYGLTNTIANFKTKLAQRRIFPANEDWRVALTEITYKQSWFNIKEPCKIRLFNEMGAEIFFQIGTAFPNPDMIIHAGYYQSINEIITLINWMMRELSEVTTEIVKLEIHENNQKVTIQPGIELGSDLKFIPTFNLEIESLLGLTDNFGRTLHQRLVLLNSTVVCDEDALRNIEFRSCFRKNKVEGFYPSDIKSGFNHIFVYSNIVRHSDVGDAFVQILTTLPNKYSPEGWGGSVHHEPKNLIYRPLQTHDFDTIVIDIKDDSGSRIPFKLGNIILKLHFLKHG